MKKRLLALMVAMAAVVSLSACGNKEVEDVVEESKNVFERLSEEADKREEERGKNVEKNKVEVENAVISTSTADVKILAYSIIPQEYEKDKNQILLFLEYTNKGEHQNSYYNGVMSAYQDGVKLNKGYAGLEYTEDNGTQIQSGVTIAVTDVFNMRNEESDIQIKYGAYGSQEEGEYILKIK